MDNFQSSNPVKEENAIGLFFLPLYKLLFHFWNEDDTEDLVTREPDELNKKK